ncbi:MAG TPA: restriction endonuclease subunit S [Gammaproteobacteria bacterium]|nr:restriction endonuclease subunit S [Gammaproteobacteria bacterium]
MVPEGWLREPLCDVADVRTGIAKGKKDLKDPVSVPYLRVANVQDGHLDLTVIKNIYVEPHQIERYRLKDGDVLMTEGGDFDKLGRGDVWKGQIDPCLHQNHVFCVRPNQKIILPYFLSSLSGSSYGKFYFLSCAKKSTNLASINSTQLKEFPVLVPPISEQRKIISILSTWDKAIETVEKLIENSKAQKKAQMQQLLTGKRRLPGFDGKWEKAYLEDITDITMGSSPSSDFYNDMGDGLPLIQGNADIKDRKTVPRVYTSQITKTCSKGNILLSVRAPVGAVAISEHDACIGRGIASIAGKNNFPLSFIYQLLLAFESKWGQISQGSTFDAVNSKDIKKLKISIPLSRKEQQKIATVLTTADKEIEALQQKRDCLKQEKKALMQQLLTGKRRVKVEAVSFSHTPSFPRTRESRRLPDNE